MVTKSETKFIKSMEFVKWESEKGKNTCEDCKGRNEKIYKISELDEDWPLHPNCCCQLVQIAAMDMSLAEGGLHNAQIKFIINNESYRNSIMRASRLYVNKDGILPEKEGRKYYQIVNGSDGSYVIFSNDGLCFITYNNFRTMFPVENVEATKRERIESEKKFFGSFQTEIDIFRKNKMAPMAYTYIMKNIYDWYLSDNAAERLMIERKLDIFRETEYEKTGDKFYDDGIKSMDKRPSFVSAEAHYFRNKLNIEYQWDDLVELNCRLPEEYRWSQMMPPSDREHQNTATEGKPNRKYVSFDGYFEAVYSHDNRLLDEETESLDMGTYNYSPFKHNGSVPEIIGSGAVHFKTDFITYYMYTNTKEDWEKRREEKKKKSGKK